MKFLFFFLGVPMMIMSFFEAIDALPYAQSVDLIVDGHEIVLTEDEQTGLQNEVFALFENARTMPAFGVVFDDMFHEEIQSGKFISIKFGRPFEINDLPFDELVFRVEPEYQGFNLCRGMHGVFQGRCIYIDLNGNNMQSLSDYIDTLPIDETPTEQEPAEQIPAEELPTEESPAEEFPAEELPVEEIPNNEEQPNEELPAEELPNNELPEQPAESAEELEEVVIENL